MKIKYYFMSMALVLSSAVITSCDDDDPVYPNPQPIEKEDTGKDLKVGTDLLKVKVGAENRQEIVISDGNGEYSGFSSNPKVAKVVNEGGKVYVEGVANGKADIIVTDAAGRHAKVSTSVYTTDVMQLDVTEMNFKHLVGETRTKKGAVTLGNGEYTIESDNENVSAEIDYDSGEFSITAKALSEAYTAKVTVSDCTGISAVVAVSVDFTDDPFDDAFVETILGTTSTTYYINYSDSYYSRYGSKINAKQEDGSYVYGWAYYSYYYMRVYVPEQKVGTYENCKVSLSPSWYDSDQREITDAQVKVLKVENSMIWIAFKYTYNGAIEYGYMVTSTVE